MTSPEKRVLFELPESDFEGGVEFRLTYEGKLLADSQRSAEARKARAKHKHEIRKKFHKQLKKLWESSPQLSEKAFEGGDFLIIGTDEEMKHTIPKLRNRFTRCGYEFVPLATRNLGLLCNVDVLLLRPDPKWTIIQGNSGDIDNRVKTLFDAFRTPSRTDELGGYAAEADEIPFFTLLEDDSLITKATMEIDTLYQPVSDPPSQNDVRIVITFRLWPSHIQVANFGFA